MSYTHTAEKKLIDLNLKCLVEIAPTGLSNSSPRF